MHLSEALIAGRAATSSAAELDEDIDMAEIDAMMNDEEEEGDAAEIEFAAAAAAAKPSESNADPIDLDEMKDAMSDAAAAAEGTATAQKVDDSPVETNNNNKPIEEEKTS